jgi:anti-anti-sigma factor
MAIDHEADVAFVQLSGILDLRSVAWFSDSLHAAMDDDVRSLVIDCEALHGMDAGASTVLHDLVSATEARSGEVLIANANATVRKVLTDADLAHVTSR